MRSLKALALAALLLFAASVFGAFQAHLSIKGTKQGPNKGQFDVSSFSWGVRPAGLANPWGCATNEIRFSAMGDGSTLLTQACQTNERIPEVELSFGNEHHVLQGVVVRSCSNNMFTLHFDRCATHPAAPVQASLVPAVNRTISPNGQLLLGNDAPQQLNFASIRQEGANALIIVVRNASPNLAQFCAKGRHIPRVTLQCRKAGSTQQEFLQYNMTEVLVSSYQVNVDGSVSIGLKFGGSQGSIAGFQDIH